MKKTLSLLVIIMLAGFADSVDSLLEAGCGLEFGSNLEPTGSVATEVYDGTAYDNGTKAQWRCKATDTDCAAINQDDSNSIYRFWNNGSISGCLDIRVNEAPPTGMVLKCSTGNAPGAAVAVVSSLTEFAQDVGVNGHVDIWCWFDFENPIVGWIFNIIARFVS